MAGVTDIEEIVKTWAWDSFKTTQSEIYKKLKFKDVKMEVNWSRVRFNPSLPKYQETSINDLQKTKVVFTSTFENNTEIEQEHSFTAERTTVCTSTTAISKGYTQGFHLELKLALPEEVASATAGFGREVHVDTADESTTEQSMSWSVNSTIKVPGRHRTTATMEVKEKEFNGQFKLTVRMQGIVIVSFMNLRDNNSFIHSCEGDISQIMSEKKGAGCSIEGKTVIWNVEGNTKFRFGVEQQVKLDENPL